MKQFKLGFTLIELLVVIAIIGSLAAMFLPNFMAARERARDSARKSDLKQIQKALELYRQDQSPTSIPATGAMPAADACWSSGAGCSGNIYMNKFPGDPNRVPSSYFYSNNGDVAYTLCACLENKADPDGVSASCDAGYICTSGKSFVVIQP